MIQLQNINKTFKSNQHELHALKNINLNIHDGEILGIVGYSGAGKSTLVRLINKLIAPTSGDIIIDGTNILSLKTKALNRMRQQIGMIFQDFNLFDQLTVYQNIKIALTISKTDVDQHMRILKLLKLVGLQDKKDVYPSQLSGGQKQRVAIARALANKPKYLLCDEATSALDVSTSYDILKLLKDIQRKTQVTIILITHQIEAIKQICDRVVVMDQGQIVEDNDILEIFMHPKHAVTKSLVKQMLHIGQATGDVYELIYQKNAEDRSVLSEAIKTFHVDINILHAHVLDIVDQHIGYLYVKIIGQDIDQTIAFIESKGIEVSLYEHI